MAHTERTITVYLSEEEKRQIKLSAFICGKSMSRYLLDLYSDRPQNLGPPDPPRPKGHNPQG